MNSITKGIVHTFLSVLAFALPVYLSGHPDIANVSIGTALTFFLNFLTSYFIPTTTGASARQ